MQINKISSQLVIKIWDYVYICYYTVTCKVLLDRPIVKQVNIAQLDAKYDIKGFAMGEGVGKWLQEFTPLNNKERQKYQKVQGDYSIEYIFHQTNSLMLVDNCASNTFPGIDILLLTCDSSFIVFPFQSLFNHVCKKHISVSASTSNLQEDNTC